MKDGLIKKNPQTNAEYPQVKLGDFLLGSQFLCGKDVRPTGRKSSPAGPLLILLSFLLIAAHAPTTGTASYYTYESCKREGTSGVWTASGERFDENALTCAMRSRDFGKYYRITNLANNKSVIVRHNDFGPNKKLHNAGRIVDLSKGAFSQIANLKQGIIRIKVEVVND